MAAFEPEPGVDDATHKLMNDMFSRFQDENKKLFKSIHITIHEAVQKEFARLYDRLDEQESRLMDVEVENKSQAKEIARLSSIVDSQRRTMDNLRITTADLEQYSRRNCLQFFGVREENNESTDDLICRIANDQLGLSITKDDIDRSHRMGNLNKEPIAKDGRPAPKRPRPIVVKFVSYRTRHSVISRRRVLKGSSIVIQEQLTKANLYLLNIVKKKKNVETAWSSDGRVIAKVAATNGRTINKVVRSENDVNAL